MRRRESAGKREPAWAEPGAAGHRADSGRAACRALPGGSPLGAAPPPGQQARRPQAHSSRRNGRAHRTTRTDRTVLLAPGMVLPRKITVKGARCARVLRRRFAPPLSVIFPGKDLGTYQEDGSGVS